MQIAFARTVLALPLPINRQYIFGTYWGPTGDQLTRLQFSRFTQTKSVSCMQKFLQEKTTCIRLTKRHEVCNSATMLEKAHMLGSNMIVRWTIKDKVLLLSTHPSDLQTMQPLLTSTSFAHRGWPVYIYVCP